jgi:carbonic anhydrase/acetyltransferase-like protein (isoleucine patch superfamily)
MPDSPPTRSPNILPYKGTWPTIAADAFIAPNAIVIGDVVIGARSNVWFNCVIRGDENYIRIGADTNVQDGTIVHISKDTAPTVIGSGITIGHGAIIHGCTLEDRCMIGIGAIVLDGAVVEEGAVVAAGAVVSPGKRVKKGEMWAGCPARMLRQVKPEEIAFIRDNAGAYVETAERYIRAGIVASR